MSHAPYAARMPSAVSQSTCRICSERSSCIPASRISPSHVTGLPIASRTTFGTAFFTCESACSKGVLPLSLLRRPPKRITFFSSKLCSLRNVADSSLLACHLAMSIPLCTTHVLGMPFVSSALCKALLTATTFVTFCSSKLRIFLFRRGFHCKPACFIWSLAVVCVSVPSDSKYRRVMSLP